jgi:hypothetical protein
VHTRRSNIGNSSSLKEISPVLPGEVLCERAHFRATRTKERVRQTSTSGRRAELVFRGAATSFAFAELVALTNSSQGDEWSEYRRTKMAYAPNKLGARRQRFNGPSKPPTSGPTISISPFAACDRSSPARSKAITATPSPLLSPKRGRKGPRRPTGTGGKNCDTTGCPTPNDGGSGLSVGGDAAADNGGAIDDRYAQQPRPPSPPLSLWSPLISCSSLAGSRCSLHVALTS